MSRYNKANYDDSNDYYNFLYCELISHLNMISKSLYRLGSECNKQDLIKQCESEVNLMVALLDMLFNENKNPKSEVVVNEVLSRLVSEYNDKCVFKVDILGDVKLPISETAFKVIMKHLIENTIVHSQNQQPVIYITVGMDNEASVIYYEDNTFYVEPVISADIHRHDYTLKAESKKCFGLMLVKYLVIKSGGLIRYHSNSCTYTEVIIRYRNICHSMQ